jgi:hypothetical protein
VEFLTVQLAALRGQRDSALAHLGAVLARDPAHLQAHALSARLKTAPSADHGDDKQSTRAR